MNLLTEKDDKVYEIGEDIISKAVRMLLQLYNHKLVKDADIIFLHWINSFLSYKTIEKVLELGKPMIWVMHDTWLFTGGCHVNQLCERYKEACGN